MQYRKLGITDIDVSAICLGTMTWGEQNTKEEAFGQLDYATAQGVNFIDTAEMYSVPAREATYGSTETIIGHWLARRGRRDDLVIATKAAGPAPWLTYVRGTPSYAPGQLRAALEASLRRLQTDYIDLYQLHWPDRHTNFFGKRGYTYQEDSPVTAWEEILETMDAFIREGKVRTVGVSNETPYGLAEYEHLARSKRLPHMQSVQNPYSLLNRTFETGLAEMAIHHRTGLLAYSPLGFGVLSGKYLAGKSPSDARVTLFPRFSRYSGPAAIEATRRYVDLARTHGLDPAMMALAYVRSRPFVTSCIIGATKMEQLRDNIGSMDLHLSDEVLHGIEAIHQDIPNPAP